MLPLTTAFIVYLFIFFTPLSSFSSLKPMPAPLRGELRVAGGRTSG
jgi:hypothetical protein